MKVIKRKTLSSLEILPTEVFFEIFDYLTIFHLFRGFIGLNKHIDDIVGSYPLILDFQEISRSKFDYICRHIQPKQVISLYLSDEFIPDQVKLFNEYFLDFRDEFIRLEKIKYINTSTILSNLPINLSSLSIKTYLKTNNTDNFITKILYQQAQYFKYLKVDGSYVFRDIHVPFPVLKKLIIDYCTITECHRILDCFKSPLTHLDIFIDREECSPRLNFEQISNSLIDLKINFSGDIIMSFDSIKELIDNLTNLKYLTVQATGTLDLMNGKLWETYLSERDILIFHFKFILSNNFTCDLDKNLLIKSFSSSFWLEQKRWYVACEKGTFKSSRPTIYSIPYFQPKLIFYPSTNFQPITTSHRDIVSKHANNLILTFHKTIPLSSIVFSHVHSLTLLTSTLPSIDILQSIIDLKKIKEFDISSVKQLSIDEFDILIEYMSNLKMIKMEYNSQFIPPLHIDSYIFIRKTGQMFIIDSSNVETFCYLFFHVKNLEITARSKYIIIRLIQQLHYLERIKIFCYQDSLLDIKYDWFKKNIPRFNKVNFTYRTTQACLCLSIGNERTVDDESTVKNTKRKTVQCGFHTSRSGCQIQ